MKRPCRCCGRLFAPRPNVPDQQYCSHRSCQNARRQKWRKEKLSSDSAYKANQHDAQRRWCEKNPDYWRNYRSSHPGYEQRNRQLQRDRNKKRTAIRPEIAKRYASKDGTAIKSGIYKIVPVEGAMIAKRYAYLVELDLISGSYIQVP